MTRGRRRPLSPTPLLQHCLLLAAVMITLLPYAWMVSSSFKANADIVSDAIELIRAIPSSTITSRRSPARPSSPQS